MLIFSVVLFFILPTTKQEECIISPFTGLALFNQPLLFWDYTSELLYPSLLNDGSRDIILYSDETIAISCVQGSLTANIELGSNTTYTTCDSDGNLRVGNEILDFNTIQCQHNSYNGLGTIVRTNFPCGNTGQRFDLQLQVNLEYDEYIPVAQFCLDPENLNILYVYNNLTKYLRFKERFVYGGAVADPLPEYDVIDIPYSDLFDSDRQRIVINDLLGLPSDSYEYVGSTRQGYYLNSIILATTEFFIYDIPQFSTMRYLNTAPIWAYISSKNWYRLTIDFLDYVRRTPLDLHVYTGTYGISTLPHSQTGEEVELYLYEGENGEKLVPVPALIWRILYDPEERSALTFVVVNNPYQVKPEDIICRDVSSDLEWLSWNKYSVGDGYSYACTYDELRSKIPHLPDLDVQGRLI